MDELVNNMIEVDSSQIESIGYSEENKVLAVEFKNGGLYYYKNVPERIFHNMIKSSSVGKYLHNNIKGVFEYQKMN